MFDSISHSKKACIFEEVNARGLAQIHLYEMSQIYLIFSAELIVKAVMQLHLDS